MSNGGGVAKFIEAIVTLVFGYVVYDLIVGGAIEDGLVEGFSPLIGPGWTLVVRILLLIASGIGLIAFLSDLLGLFRNAAHGLF